MREWNYRAPIALIGHDGCKRGSGYNERRNRSTQTKTALLISNVRYSSDHNIGILVFLKRFKMLRYLYTFFLCLLTPFILLRLYWKGRRLPAYRQRISERFSLGNLALPQVDVWLHAVSFGEIVAVTPLIDALLVKQLRVLVTTMTPTGSQQVIARFGERVAHQYIPYDFPWVLRRFFKKINARVGIIMETELWPNLIHQATKAHLPLLLVNARISDKAYQSYKKLRFFFKPVLMQFKSIFAQSEVDAQRFIALGAPLDRVLALGNMKFDLQTQVLNQVVFEQLQTEWGKHRPVLMAASTHDDEENQLLARLSGLKSVIPNLMLLIAPRHPERFKAVYDLSQRHGFKTGLRSQSGTIDSDTDVVVLDSMGELLGFYQLSDYAFVGGSLVAIGGHNVLEPIAMQVPVFCGPFMSNSKSICADLCTAGALQVVDDADALIATIIMMYHNPSQRTRQITNATAVLEANRGSVARYVEEVLSSLRTQ